MFYIIGIVFGFIIYVSLFGDYEGKEIEEWKKKWERIIGEKYYD